MHFPAEKKHPLIGVFQIGLACAIDSSQVYVETKMTQAAAGDTLDLVLLFVPSKEEKNDEPLSLGPGPGRK